MNQVRSIPSALENPNPCINIMNYFESQLHRGWHKPHNLCHVEVGLSTFKVYLFASENLMWSVGIISCRSEVQPHEDEGYGSER